MTLTLAAGPLTAHMVPDAGGVVSALTWQAPGGRRHALLRDPSGAAPGRLTPNRFGTWAMLPFANRAFGDVIDDGQSRFTVASGDPVGAIHGFGWQSPWDVLDADSSHTVLGHTRTEGYDPYRYRARQVVSLDNGGMTITVSITNLAHETLPYGIGHHPWFACAPDTSLTLRAESALVLGEGYRARGVAALTDGGPYAEGPVFASDAEAAWSFIGWDGTARIETPSTGLAITLSASESLRCPVVWAPAGADFLCVEPQSHAIGSPSEPTARAASPLTRLAPGETLEGWLRIAPEALGRRD